MTKDFFVDFSVNIYSGVGYSGAVVFVSLPVVCSVSVGGLRGRLAEEQKLLARAIRWWLFFVPCTSSKKRRAKQSVDHE